MTETIPAKPRNSELVAERIIADAYIVDQDAQVAERLVRRVGALRHNDTLALLTGWHPLVEG